MAVAVTTPVDYRVSARPSDRENGGQQVASRYSSNLILGLFTPWHTSPVFVKCTNKSSLYLAPILKEHVQPDFIPWHRIRSIWRQDVTYPGLKQTDKQTIAWSDEPGSVSEYNFPSHLIANERGLTCSAHSNQWS